MRATLLGPATIAVAAIVVAPACGSSTPPVTTTAAPPVATPTAAPVDQPPPPPVARPRAIAQPALIATPLAGDTANVTIHRLSNGITVYLSPDPTAATIVAHVVVHAGSSNDPERSTGLAHYLEHMLFKGTEQLGTLDYAKEKPHLDKIASLYAELRGPDGDRDRDRILAAIDAETLATTDVVIPNELDSVFDRMGMTGTNAFTSSDETTYVCALPRNRVAQWARVEADRFQHPVFRLFWPELEAVYEEKNRAQDNPGRRINDALYKTVFPHHGYGWSDTLGEVEHLKKPAYTDMVAFFDRYYTPQNMAIVMSGGIDDSVLPTLEKELGGLLAPRRRGARGRADRAGPRPHRRRGAGAVDAGRDPGVAAAGGARSRRGRDRRDGSARQRRRRGDRVARPEADAEGRQRRVVARLPARGRAVAAVGRPARRPVARRRRADAGRRRRQAQARRLHRRRPAGRDPRARDPGRAATRDQQRPGRDDGGRVRHRRAVGRRRRRAGAGARADQGRHRPGREQVPRRRRRRDPQAQAGGIAAAHHQAEDHAVQGRPVPALRVRAPRCWRCR